VIFPPSRVFQSATFLLALMSAHVSFSQGPSGNAGSPSEISRAITLPDAPSYSSSQQTTATPQPAQPPANETDEQRKERERKEAQHEVDVEKKQRIGGIIPDFNVSMNGQGVALTPKQKFDLSYHTIIDPYTIGLAFIVGGGLGELEDSHTGYGHGPSGFFKRVGASYADNVDGNFIGNALLPVILHQDPRYFRKGTGSIKSRIIYSALTTFICRSDAGKNQFNISNVMGNFISGAISNAYYPASERGVGLTLTNAFVVTAEGMVGAQLLEFSPDVTNAIKRHHARKLLQKQQAAAAAGKPAPATPPVPVTPPPPPPSL
jgi:hypothetical protein